MGRNGKTGAKSRTYQSPSRHLEELLQNLGMALCRESNELPDPRMSGGGKR